MPGNGKYPIKFEYHEGDESGYVVVSADNFNTKYPLSRDEENGIVLHTTLYLNPGTYRYKFLIDAKWTVSNMHPQTSDAIQTQHNYVKVDVTGPKRTKKEPEVIYAFKGDQEFGTRKLCSDDLVDHLSRHIIPMSFPPCLNNSCLLLDSYRTKLTEGIMLMPIPQHHTLGHLYNADIDSDDPYTSQSTAITQRFRSKFTTSQFFWAKSTMPVSDVFVLNYIRNGMHFMQECDK